MAPSMIPEDVQGAFAGRSALVTGGTGLIGREVVRRLCDFGAHVTSVSLDDLAADPRAKSVRGDLRSLDFCMEVTRGIDFVLHVAGIKGSVEVTRSQPASMFVPLLLMNTAVLEAARLNGAARVVYTSTIGTYGPADTFVEDEYDPLAPPMDVYPGWAKRMAEMQIAAYGEQYGLDTFAVVRPCNVYGPGDNFDPASAMVVPALMARIAAGERPLRVWGDGSAVRDFAFSTDVAEGIILALHHGTRRSFVNLGGHDCSVRELVETLARHVGVAYEFDTSKPAGYPVRVMDISRARDWIGYTPQIDLAEGLARTWAWFQQHRQSHLRRKDFFAAGGA
jgi:GDP-L-fucose synthase